MNGWELREPYFLLLGLLALPIFWVLRTSVGRVRFSALRLLPAESRSWRAVLSWVPDVLVALAAVLFAVALSGPRLINAEGRIQREGIAIMMVLDRSSSMAALDLSPEHKEMTRLDVVKEDFVAFVKGDGEDLEGRSDDAIGLVSFARFPDSSSPITLDHDNVVHAAQAVELVPIGQSSVFGGGGPHPEDGTAIGDAMLLGLERLRTVKAKSRVMVLLTDGKQTTGSTKPLDAAEDAKRMGIKVYTIGAGTQGEAFIRVCCDAFGRETLQRTRVEIDEETLKGIAEKTDGMYFRATDRASMRAVYDAIDELEKTEIVEERVVEYEELYERFAAGGLLLACAGWLLSLTLFRRLP